MPMQIQHYVLASASTLEISIPVHRKSCICIGINIFYKGGKLLRRANIIWRKKHQLYAAVFERNEANPSCTSIQSDAPLR
jgi:hypothetical protein